jgi:hypothetical protein
MGGGLKHADKAKCHPRENTSDGCLVGVVVVVIQFGGSRDGGLVPVITTALFISS